MVVKAPAAWWPRAGKSAEAKGLSDKPGLAKRCAASGSSRHLPRIRVVRHYEGNESGWSFGGPTILLHSSPVLGPSAKRRGGNPADSIGKRRRQQYRHRQGESFSNSGRESAWLPARLPRGW